MSQLSRHPASPALPSTVDAAEVERFSRIADEWWHPRPAGKTAPANIVPPVRDYYRVEDNEGTRFWLFRDGMVNTAKWYLHGFCA